MARYDEMVVPGLDDDDSDEEVGVSGGTTHKAKPRRKSHQRPQGSDQIRQAFSKRKKGLVLKAYQLSALTDAKVFMFIVNDKGTSWAYATPGFAASLSPELLKEMRLLAQVPDQAKLITEVMPDPPNIRQPDTAGPTAEHPAIRRPDQVPGSYSTPCTRTATGAIPTRSRSSYSGGSAGEPPALLGSVIPVARSGSTTTNARVHSAAQSEEQSPTKVRPRPPSGSSMAAGGIGARASSTAGHSSQAMQQAQQLQQHGYGGKFGSMEPPTPCGVYLMGQPAPANCTESPTLLSEVAGSCGSPSSRAAPAAAGPAGVQLSEAMLQQWQQQAMLQAGLQWVPQEQQQQLQQGWDMSMRQPTHQQQQCKGWVKAELVGQQQVGSDTANGYMLAPSINCQQYAGGNLQQAGSSMDAAAGWQQQMAGCAGSNTGSSSHPNVAAFESLQRCLPPLRVGKVAHNATEGGPHSAPAGAVNSLLGPPSSWVDFDLKEVNQLRVLSDTAAYGASSSGYSSYGPSPTYAAAAGMAGATDSSSQQQHAAGVMFAGSAPAAAFMLPPDSSSADPSPTAALSHKMCSLLAMESPLHPSQQQLPMHYNRQQQQQQEEEQEVPGSWAAMPDHCYSQGQQQVTLQQQQQQQQQRAATPQLLDQQELYPQDQQEQAEQQQAQQHNQGAYIPRTDDLVSDPLMDMLLDQATQNKQQQQQQRQLNGQVPHSSSSHHRQQHMSIMEATLQQQQYQCQQKQQPQYSYVSISTPCGSAAAAAAAAGRPRQLVHVASMLDHLPVPPKNASEAERAAWAAQVKQMVDSLPAHEQNQFLDLVSGKMKAGNAMEPIIVSAAAACGGGFGNTGSNVCSPVLSSAANNTGCSPVPATNAVPPAAVAAAPTASGYASRVASGVSGGKQRHGPSRLSATSPAIESAVPPVATSTGRPVDGLTAGTLPGQQLVLGPGMDLRNPAGPAGSTAGMYMVPASSGYGVTYGFDIPAISAPGGGLPQMPAASGGMTGNYCNNASMGLVVGYGCSPQAMQMPVSAGQMTMMCQQQQQQLLQHGVSNGMVMAPPALPFDAVARAAAPSPTGACSAPAACGGGLTDMLSGRAGGGATCSSPLKRGQPCSYGLLSGLADVDEAVSPLKRACRELPEPPSFATLMQTEDVEEDAVAWAASVGANDSLKLMTSFASLGRDLGSLCASGSLPTFVNVNGSEAVAAQMAEAEAGAAAAQAQQQQQQGSVDVAGSAAGGGTVGDGTKFIG